MFAGHDPTVVLEFGASGALGSVVFVKRGTREGVNPKVPMAQWIRKTAGRYVFLCVFLEIRPFFKNSCFLIVP